MNPDAAWISKQSRSLRTASRDSSLCALLIWILPCLLVAEEAPVATVAKSYLDKAVASAKKLVTGGFAKEAPDPSTDPDQIAREAALKEATDALFVHEGGYSFTQSRWGASPTPFQIEGLELVPLPESPLSVSDHAVGIDMRLTYEFKAATHRRFHEQTGWGRWMKGVPPHLDSITLVREQGVWKVAIAPTWAYSVR